MFGSWGSEQTVRPLHRMTPLRDDPALAWLSLGEKMRIDALGPDGPYQTRNREIVTTTAGVTVAELSLVPPLYVSRSINAQRTTRPLPASMTAAPQSILVPGAGNPPAPDAHKALTARAYGGREISVRRCISRSSSTAPE